jgi:hypothetical protein
MKSLCLLGKWSTTEDNPPALDLILKNLNVRQYDKKRKKIIHGKDKE